MRTEIETEINKLNYNADDIFNLAAKYLIDTKGMEAENLIQKIIDIKLNKILSIRKDLEIEI